MSFSNEENLDAENVDNMPDTPSIAHPKMRRRRTQSSRIRFFKKLRRSIKWRILLVSTLIIIIVSSITVAVLITDAVADLRGAWQSLDRVLTTVMNSDGTDLTLDDFARLQSSTNEMEIQLSITRQRIGLVNLLVNLNPEWVVAVNTLEISQLLIYSANNMLEGVQPTLNFMVSGDTEEIVVTRISSGERVVELLELGQGRFALASDNLLTVGIRLNEIDLSDVSPELLLQIEDLRRFHEQLTSINELLISSPELLTVMLGLNSERSYLVLAQNNDELRPSGGYISTWGWFTVRSARIIDYDYSPTTTTSPNPPDSNFLEEQNIVIPDWWLRYSQPVYVAWDGSWFPDFPSTAEMAINYYNIGDNIQSPVDGVLAIDISGFELMLSAMDEVFVSDYSVTVTRENFRELVYDIRAFEEGITPHKEFIIAIYQEIFEKWSHLDQEQMPVLLGGLLEGFQQNHIMFYFADTDLNDAMDTLGWSGRQLPGIENDYILVVDANLGNKSNNSVNQPITYDVEVLADGTLNSRLTVGFEYFDDMASQDPAINALYHGPLDYSSLLQIFLPAGSFMNETNITGNYTLLENEQHNLLITRSVIEYDSSERYQLSYTTPALIQSIGDLQVYRLLIQNQPGSREQSLNVQVRLPLNTELVSSEPEANAVYTLEQPVVDYRLELNGDIWIELIYQDR